MCEYTAVYTTYIFCSVCCVEFRVARQVPCDDKLNKELDSMYQHLNS